MIISFSALSDILASAGVGFDIIGVKQEELLMKLSGLESYITSITHNNFVNRRKRFTAKSEGGKLLGVPLFVEKDTTLYISDSINRGIWKVGQIDNEENTASFSEYLADADKNTVGVVEYPPAIVNGVINLVLWDLKHDYSKDGIKSETISRHTVTYFDTNSGDKYMNYPAAMFDFLKPFYKARF